jgi:hypothetical protein
MHITVYLLHVSATHVAIFWGCVTKNTYIELSQKLVEPMHIYIYIYNIKF